MERYGPGIQQPYRRLELPHSIKLLWCHISIYGKTISLKKKEINFPLNEQQPLIEMYVYILIKHINPSLLRCILIAFWTNHSYSMILSPVVMASLSPFPHQPESFDALLLHRKAYRAWIHHLASALPLSTSSLTDCKKTFSCISSMFTKSSKGVCLKQSTEVVRQPNQTSLRMRVLPLEKAYRGCYSNPYIGNRGRCGWFLH